MSEHERRRAPRHTLDWPGRLRLPGGRAADVRIVNLGGLGALVTMADLEDRVAEGDRVVLVHPMMDDGGPTQETGETAGLVVRVDLEFSGDQVARHAAICFDEAGATP